MALYRGRHLQGVGEKGNSQKRPLSRVREIKLLPTSRKFEAILRAGLSKAPREDPLGSCEAPNVDGREEEESFNHVRFGRLHTVLAFPLH